MTRIVVNDEPSPAPAPVSPILTEAKPSTLMSKSGADFFMTKMWTQLANNPDCKWMGWDWSGTFLIIYNTDRLMEEIKERGTCKQKDYDSFARQLRIYRWVRARTDDSGRTRWPEDAKVWRHPTLTRDSAIEDVGAISRNAPPKPPRPGKDGPHWFGPEDVDFAPHLLAERQVLTTGRPSSSAMSVAAQPASASTSIAQHQTTAGPVPLSLQTAIIGMQQRNATSGPLSAIRSSGNNAQLPRFTMNLPDFKGDMFTPSASAMHAAADDPDVFDQLPWEQVVHAPIILPMEEATDLMSTEVDLSSRVARQRRPVGTAVLSSVIDPLLAGPGDADNVPMPDD